MDNIIGIREYCRTGRTPEPYSGLYIDSIPGFTLENLSDTADLENTETAYDLFRLKTELAIQTVKQDFFSYLRKYNKIQPNSINEIRSAGVYQSEQDIEFNEKSPVQRGVVVHNRISCANKLTTFKITEVKVWGRGTDSSFISIIDGTEITNVPVNLDPFNPVTVKLNYTAKTNSVLVVMDNTEIETYPSTVYARNRYPYYSSCVNSCNSCNNCDELYMFGWNGDTQSFETYGIAVTGILYCNFDTFWCAVKDVLPLPVLYKTGLLITEEMRYGLMHQNARRLEQSEEYINQLKSTYSSYLIEAVRQTEYISKTIDCLCMRCSGAKISSIGFY